VFERVSPSYYAGKSDYFKGGKEVFTFGIILNETRSEATMLVRICPGAEQILT
jgi:hypothetical protein